MFEIRARVQGGGFDEAVVGCFDPTVVIVRLRKAFPEVTVDQEDFAWKYHDAFKRRGVVDGAVRIAECDARRRGPIWRFHLPMGNGRNVTGWAERYSIRILDEEPIPEPVQTRFLAFLEELRFSPAVEVASVRIEGNDEYPAEPARCT
jgi:hypothetical protein